MDFKKDKFGRSENSRVSHNNHYIMSCFALALRS